jgi:single-stranded-DNA-specific exonuclease
MPRIIPRGYPEEAVRLLAGAGIAPLLARIYAARGISEAAQLETGTSHLLPFTLLKNAQQMAVLLADAIAACKKLLVVADYDADGATACALGLRGLRAMGADVDFIVPNRFEYGYGLTPEIVRLAASRPPAGRVSDGVPLAGAAPMQPDILITVDNGIASVEGVAEANRLGMQVLVTDHHLPGEALPDALCIVNPNQPGCDFPSKHLSGAGVMFYVLLALRAEMRSRGAISEEQGKMIAGLLDLVALGTIADVVKLDQNNRILVHLGLQRIRSGRACAGINALLLAAKKHPSKASAHDLGFAAGPRLNAAGRLEDMSLGIRCLLADTPAEAAQLAAQLDELNRERRDIEAGMQEAALAALGRINVADSCSLAMFDEGWHQGVIGILASRLKDRFHRPVIAFARAQEGILKGSGRSIPGFHLRDALDLLSKRHPHLLHTFGGHAMAAGLSIAEEHFADFAAAFEGVAQDLLAPADLTRMIETDGALSPGECTLEAAHSLERQVWGQGFPQPLFEGIFDVVSQRVVGEKHRKLFLRPYPADEQSRATDAYDAIQFFSAGPLPKRILAVYSLEVNEYNGSEGLQFVIHCWQDVPD